MNQLSTSEHGRPLFREAARSVIEIPGLGPIIVSPDEVDDFGQPRVLSKFEVAFYSLAWRVVVGLLIGVGLAASLLAVQNAVNSQPQFKATPPNIKSTEATP